MTPGAIVNNFNTRRVLFPQRLAAKERKFADPWISLRESTCIGPN
jgi:hypothetical protein